jgi:hypothetical protein
VFLSSYFRMSVRPCLRFVCGYVCSCVDVASFRLEKCVYKCHKRLLRNEHVYLQRLNALVRRYLVYSPRAHHSL